MSLRSPTETENGCLSPHVQKNPSRLRWKQLDGDIVIKPTGVFTDAAQVRVHLEVARRK